MCVGDGRNIRERKKELKRPTFLPIFGIPVLCLSGIDIFPPKQNLSPPDGPHGLSASGSGAVSPGISRQPVDQVKVGLGHDLACAKPQDDVFEKLNAGVVVRSLVRRLFPLPKRVCAQRRECQRIDDFGDVFGGHGATVHGRRFGREVIRQPMMGRRARYWPAGVEACDRLRFGDGALGASAGIGGWGREACFALKRTRRARSESKSEAEMTLGGGGRRRRPTVEMVSLVFTREMLVLEQYVGSGGDDWPA